MKTLKTAAQLLTAFAVAMAGLFVLQSGSPIGAVPFVAGLTWFVLAAKLG